jgi:HD-GYP domain-containing protein (c-di-GMP phosphodiesterase class II)
MGSYGSTIQRQYVVRTPPPSEESREDDRPSRLRTNITRLSQIGAEATIRHARQNASSTRSAELIGRIAGQMDEVAANGALHPGERASLAYSRMARAVEAVFEHPTPQCIAATRRAVGTLVENILSDDDTARAIVHVWRNDAATYTHSANVGVLGIALARRLYGLGQDHDLAELATGFFLHDLGKACIDPTILSKPAALTERERVSIRSHPFWSYALLAQAGHASEECSVIALQHHEREDGSGYPQGIAGAEIHRYARICSIADVFDALVSDRPYRRSMDAPQALRTMRDEMLGHFQRDLLENFIMLFSTTSR